MVGEKAEVNGRGDLILGNGNYDKTHALQRTAGSIERIVRSDGQMSVEGWAGMGESSPAAVIVVGGGKIIGEAPVTLPRKDVAAATRNAKLGWSGFQMDFPVAALPKRCGELHWYFVDFATYEEFPMSMRNCRRMEIVATFGREMLGARATVIDGKLTIAGHDDRFTHTNEFVGGSLDKIVRQGSHVHLEGWGRMGESSPLAVIAVAGDRVVGVAPIVLRRTDVAALLKNPGLTLSGFKMDVPVAGVAPGAGKLHLYLVDENSYGEFSFGARDNERLQAITR